MDFSKIKYILSPMASHTDAAFRWMCRRYGADYVVTEFVSAEAVVRENKKTQEMLFISDEERPCGIQIFGSKPSVMAKASHILEKKADVIDINLGCPAPKVLRGGGGASLLDKPKLINEIIGEIVSTIKKPVTAKMRLGIKTKDKAVEIAKLIEKSGASALAVHGRTLDQIYSGKADWNMIKQIKDALSIPVFGNGDVVDYSSAKRMFDETGCDAVMIGRAALGNPFIFKQCKQKKDFEVTPEMRLKAFDEYLKTVRELGIKRSVGDLKAQALCFIRGIPGATKLRSRVCMSKTEDEIKEIMEIK
ncbi:MAG: tRNA dihydrouridine synthase DusB [Candidatus Micrarchaeota archaeon]